MFSNQVQPGRVWAACHLSNMWESLLNQMIKGCKKRGRYWAKPSQTIDVYTGIHSANCCSYTSLSKTHLCPKMIFCSSAEFNLVFPLALYVPLIHSMSVPSKRKIATTKNQSTDTMRCTLNPTGLWPSALNINLSPNYFQHSIFPRVLLRCIVPTALIGPQTEMDLGLMGKSLSSGSKVKTVFYSCCKSTETHACVLI